MAHKTYEGAAAVDIDAVQRWLDKCSTAELHTLKSKGIERKEVHDRPTIVTVEVKDDFNVDIDVDDVVEWMDDSSDQDIRDIGMQEDGVQGYDNTIGINGTHAQALIDIDRIQDLCDRMDTSEILAKLAA